MKKTSSEKPATSDATIKHIKEDWLGLLKSFTIALLLAMLFRTFAYEPFHIPSSSMKPTLLIGDYIFVSKYSYGYSRYSLPFGLPLIKDRIFFTQPARGDVVVFKLPSDNETNYIKRLIGLPGDRIQVLNGVLFINGMEVPRVRLPENFIDTFNDTTTEIPQYIEKLPEGVSYRVLDQYQNTVLDNTDVYTVPAGHYFFMGDNRDNSQDSRVDNVVGFVPEVNLVGRAEIIFFSKQVPFWKFWEWFGAVRINRTFSTIQ